MTRFGAYGHYASLTIVALLPIAALFGNAPADIALVLTVIIYLATEKEAISNLINSRLFQLCFIFWLWILICSAVSPFPKHSFQDSLPWIRFPIFALVLSEYLTKSKTKHNLVFFVSAITGTIIEVFAMIYQFINRRIFIENIQEIDVRLTGTFSKQMAGWYIISFSLIAILILFQAIRDEKLDNNKKLLVGIFTIISTIAIVISGEIYNTLAFIITLLSFFIVRHPREIKRDRIILLSVAAISLLAVMILLFDNSLYARMSRGLTTRLPWMPTSDYYTIWNYAIDVAMNNYIFGIGPKNTFNYCVQIKDNHLIEALTNVTIINCPWHPHNLYIQIFSETGIVGLIFFSSIAIYILNQATSAFIKSKYKNNIAFVLSIISFIPIQTYSQAFGQSRNFYFWIVISAILYTIQINTGKKNKDKKIFEIEKFSPS